MVGVPGKSKACHTCKERRIACGLQRPECHQCLKSKRVCGGYQKDRIFIIGKGSSYQAKKKQPKSTSTSPEKDVSTDQIVQAKDDLNQKKGDRFDHRSHPGTQALSQVDIFIPQAAYRQQLVSTYVNGYMPMTRLGTSEHRSWLCLVPELPDMTKALETSILGLSMAKLGRDFNDESLLQESLVFYTKGLQQLQKALWDPELMYRDETLGACVALSLYEVVECPSESRHAYVSHQQGCSRLVQLRGPEAHASGLGHQIFLNFRVQAVLEALKNHQSTYLSESTWTQKPWSNRPKAAFDRVFDYFLLAPELFRKGDQLGKIDVWSSLRETISIINDCMTADLALEHLLEEITNESTNPLFWSELSQKSNEVDDDSKDGKVFPVAFHFPDLRTANTLMYYWSTLLMMWSGLCQLHQHLANLESHGIDLETLNAMDSQLLTNHQPLDQPTAELGEAQSESKPYSIPPLAHRVDFASIAWNICQSVEYCMQDEMRDFGPQCAAVPLQIVVDTMKQILAHSRQLQWAESWVKKIARDRLRILKYT